MIITCEQCETRFQLDPSKIPAAGARVRCSRCKHVFHVASPTASPAEALEDVALSAAADASSAPAPSQDTSAPSAPAPSQDTASPSAPGAADDAGGDDPFADTMMGMRFDESVAGGPRPSATTEAPSETLAGAEEDWEFNDEPPTQVVDPRGEPEPEEPLRLADRRRSSAEAEAPGEDDFEIGGATTAPPAAEAAAHAEDDFDLGGLDDLGGEEETQTAGETTDEDLFGGFDDLIGDDAEDEADAASEDAASAGLGAAGAAGDAESDVEAPASGPSLCDSAPAAVAGPGERDASERHADTAPRAGSDAAGPLVRRLPVRVSEPVATAIGASLVVALLLVAVTAVGLNAVRAPAPVPFTPGRSAPGLLVEALGVRLVDNVQAGPVLVVGGALGQALPRGSGLRVVLLDAQGTRLREAWAGPALGERWIRESAPADIQAELDARADQFAFMGGRIQAVFAEPPPEAADFLVESAPRASAPFVAPTPQRGPGDGPAGGPGPEGPSGPEAVGTPTP